MIVKELTVNNTAGFHVRSATRVNQIVLKYGAKVTASRQGKEEADCRSPLDLLTLMAPMGTVLTFRVDGEDEQKVVDELQELFDKKFYEDEFKTED